MAYEKTVWKDEIVQHPKRFTATENDDGTLTLEPAFGTTLQEGTPVNAANLNNIEEGIASTKQDIADINDSLGTVVYPVSVDFTEITAYYNPTDPLTTSSSNTTYYQRSTSFIDLDTYGRSLRILLDYGTEKTMWVAYTAIYKDGHSARTVLVNNQSRKKFDSVVNFDSDAAAVSISYDSYNTNEIKVFAHKSNADSYAITEKIAGFETISGYYSTDGVITAQTSKYEKSTPYIDVRDFWTRSGYVDYDLDAQQYMQIIMVEKFDNGHIQTHELVSAKGTVGKSKSGRIPFAIPDGVAQIAFSWRSFGYTDPVQLYVHSNAESLQLLTSKGYYKPDGSYGTGTQTEGGEQERITQVFYPADFGRTVYVSLTHSVSRNMWLVMAVRKTDGTISRTVLKTGQATAYSQQITFDSDVELAAFAYSSYGDAVFAAYGRRTANTVRNTQTPGAVIAMSGRNLIDHTFIGSMDNGSAIIPNQSAKNVETAKRFGFSVIEGNVQVTSDGVPIVLHGANNKFYNGVYSLDGTDISDVTVKSKTLEWIKQNVRFKSTHDEYKTAPLTFEEFSKLCKYHGLVPLAQSDAGSVAVCEKVAGKGNVIAYNATRITTDAPCTSFLRFATKDEILNHCRTIGYPFIYSMGNPADFTDAQLSDIIQSLHREGFMLSVAGCYLSETETQRCLKLGADFSSSDSHVPYFEHGNLCECFSLSDYANSGNVYSKTGLASVSIGAEQVDITFTGSITVAMGRINATYTASGTETIHTSSYILDASPSLSVTVNSGTVQEIIFKAKRC